MNKMKYCFLCFLFATVACSSGSKDNSVPTVTPTNLKVTAIVAVDSSGNVSFTATANNATSFDFDFGNGIFQTVPSGVVTYKYTATGNYSVNVIAKSATGQTVLQTVQVSVGVKINLVWSDEFDTPGSPDASKWSFNMGTGSGGWGNNELEYYTNRTDNAIVSNGTLKIIAKKETYSGSAYTSARMVTQNLFSFKYGKIEVRAKLPVGVGTWPAIWMLGNNISTVSWPACGEIDIMEERGSELNKIYGTLHYPTQANVNGDGSNTTIATATSEFHRYAAIWSATSIQLLIDDVVFYTLPNTSSLPFNQNFFVILNLAMGGNFAGAVDPNFSSAQMEIDYVRVYQ
jgi:beta-glucanase (GH16 family)